MVKCLKCKKDINPEEEYVYYNQQSGYCIEPVFSGLALCNDCNQKEIMNLFKKHPRLSELVIFGNYEISIDWDMYWKEFENIFPRRDKNPDSVDRYYDFISLMIYLGKFTRVKSFSWKFEDGFHSLCDYLGPVFFIDKWDALNYLACMIIHGPFRQKTHTSIEFVSDVITKDYIDSYIETIREGE